MKINRNIEINIKINNLDKKGIPENSMVAIVDIISATITIEIFQTLIEDLPHLVR